MAILAAFILALVIALLFPGSRTGAIASLFIFFVVLFLAGIASIFWIIPFGPVIWGVAWLPMLFFILLVAFLFSAPVPRGRNAADTKEKFRFGTISIFTWLLFFLLLMAIIFGYYKAR